MNRWSGSRLDEALRALADRTILGALVLVGSIPIVTAPAALAAGAAAARRKSLRDAIPHFIDVYRYNVLHLLRPGMVAVVLIGSAATSVVTVSPTATGLTRGLIVVSGGVSALTAGALIVCSAVVAASAGPAEFRRAGEVLLRSPGAVAVSVGLMVVMLAVLILIPVLALPLAGSLSRRISSIQPPFVRRSCSADAPPDADCPELIRFRHSERLEGFGRPKARLGRALRLPSSRSRQTTRSAHEAKGAI